MHLDCRDANKIILFFFFDIPGGLARMLNLILLEYISSVLINTNQTFSFPGASCVPNTF